MTFPNFDRARNYDYQLIPYLPLSDLIWEQLRRAISDLTPSRYLSLITLHISASQGAHAIDLILIWLYCATSAESIRLGTHHPLDISKSDHYTIQR